MDQRSSGTFDHEPWLPRLVRRSTLLLLLLLTLSCFLIGVFVLTYQAADICGGSSLHPVLLQHCLRECGLQQPDPAALAACASSKRQQELAGGCLVSLVFLFSLALLLVRKRPISPQALAVLVGGLVIASAGAVLLILVL